MSPVSFLALLLEDVSSSADLPKAHAGPLAPSPDIGMPSSHYHCSSTTVHHSVWQAQTTSTLLSALQNDDREGRIPFIRSSTMQTSLLLTANDFSQAFAPVCPLFAQFLLQTQTPKPQAHALQPHCLAVSSSRSRWVASFTAGGGPRAPTRGGTECRFRGLSQRQHPTVSSLHHAVPRVWCLGGSSRGGGLARTRALDVADDAAGGVVHEFDADLGHAAAGACSEGQSGGLTTGEMGGNGGRAAYRYGRGRG